jgi:hypothetical protein
MAYRKIEPLETSFKKVELISPDAVQSQDRLNLWDLFSKSYSSLIHMSYCVTFAWLNRNHRS